MDSSFLAVLASGGGGVVLGVILATGAEEWRQCRRQRHERGKITAAVRAALVRNRQRLEVLVQSLESENSPPTVHPELLDWAALRKYGLLDEGVCLAIDEARDRLEDVRRAMDEFQRAFALAVAQGTHGTDTSISVRSGIVKSLQERLIPGARAACDQALAHMEP